MDQNELRDEHLRVLGPELGPLYSALWSEVAWLHAKWNQYRALYAESPDRIDLLNEVAGFFFRVIQNVLWEDIVLHVARLTDPLQSAGKDNLTLLRLAETVKEPALSFELKNLGKQAQSAADFARAWRNKHLAHRDLALAVDDRAATSLPGISRKEIGRALVGAGRVLNKIESHFWQSETAFAQVIPGGGDAETLADYLQAAVDTEGRQ
jgi:hypothetical protein